MTPTAAPTSVTIAAAPTKENNMYAVPTLTAAQRIEQRGGRYEPVGAYIDTTPPEYDDLSSYALAAADEAIQAHALGEISDQAFDEAFSAALKMDRAPVIQAAIPWALSEADELAIEEMMEESRPKVHTPPVNGITEVEAATIASCRRQEMDAEYSAMLADQERDDDLREIDQLDFSSLEPVVEYNFEDLYEMEAAA